MLTPASKALLLSTIVCTVMSDQNGQGGFRASQSDPDANAYGFDAMAQFPYYNLRSKKFFPPRQLAATHMYSSFGGRTMTMDPLNGFFRPNPSQTLSSSAHNVQPMKRGEFLFAKRKPLAYDAMEDTKNCYFNPVQCYLMEKRRRR